MRDPFYVPTGYYLPFIGNISKAIYKPKRSTVIKNKIARKRGAK